MKTNPIHSFHIPVMGLAYTIDSPIRVGQYGISSAISVMDDELIERMNKFYCEKFELPYQEISRKIEDFRAKRITAYLNTVDTIVQSKFEQFKSSIAESKKELEHYADMLPSVSQIRKNILKSIEENTPIDKVKALLDNYLSPGSIDINIMTKVDRENTLNNEVLPVEYNDAHAALRGFANSKLQSSIILSAGMNPKLFSYFESFNDFFPTENNTLAKKIILKVSDFRSAMIQGNFLAKKGLWVSEYRIESGLNCGGHAFATDGYLMGVILEEFRDKRDELIQSNHDLMCKALEQKGKYVPNKPLELKVTAQGGVGTAEEHQFILDYYNVDSVGWGTPFLLVPEASSVDKATRELLAKATEADLYLSDASPLGIPFNNVRGTTNESLKNKRAEKNRLGSSCPRKYLALNKSYTTEGICTASRKYQEIQLEELTKERDTLGEVNYQNKLAKLTEKACLCIGLANASLLENNLPIKGEAQGVAVCPGPNMAYFSKEVSLKQMVNHIYGRDNVIEVTNRPHVFMKELRMYVDHFRKEKAALLEDFSAMKEKKFKKLRENLIAGVAYYKQLFNTSTLLELCNNEEIQRELNSIDSELRFL